MYVQERRGLPKNAYWSPQRTDDWPLMRMKIVMFTVQSLLSLEESRAESRARCEAYEALLADGLKELSDAGARAAGRDAEVAATTAKRTTHDATLISPIYGSERPRPFTTTTRTGRPGLSKQQRNARGRRGRKPHSPLVPRLLGISRPGEEDRRGSRIEDQPRLS